ncbi:uncharacterized protein C8A04DRAFT_37112 [Dichotomopilus funicola]|uniref:N-acetyltransferase domain-containing protein n=1 Tax=Dichotomopilus funicola TaxID=1934379 RepID=A0AAN6V3N5_9PEZI|nr:hypothetical protein C8A04DRAFT_37112 [Dichotomopilus funicola]
MRTGEAEHSNTLDLDSTEVQSAFLSAIGFHHSPTPGDSAPKGVEKQQSFPNRGGQTKNGNRLPRVEAFTDSPAAPAWVPGIQPNHSAEAPPAQQRRIRNGPADLTYWEAQRIAKGIVDPSSYTMDKLGPVKTQTKSPTLTQRDENRRSNLPSKPNGWGWDDPVPEGTPIGHAIPDDILRDWYGDNKQQTGGGGNRGRRNRGAGARRNNKPVATPSGNNPRPICLDRIEPDLRTYKMPRPDMNFPGSETSELSVGSGFQISDSGIEAREPLDKKSADVRHDIGLKHNIHRQHDGTWTTYNWDGPTGRDNDEVFLEDAYLGAFIGAWMDDIPNNVVASFDKGEQPHWTKDIDVLTGELLPPVEQPTSVTNPTPLDTNTDRRRQNWTATLLQTHYTTQGPGRRRGRNSDHTFRNEPNQLLRVVETPPPRVVNLPVIEEPVIEEPVVQRPEYHRYVPRVASFLRPAEQSDIGAIWGIYNWEVQNGTQMLDSQDLTEEQMTQIFNTTKEVGLPFLVAVRGSARGDKAPTRGHIVHSPFKQVPVEPGDEYGEVIGFAYLSVWKPGLAGSATGSSRGTAQAHVVVHPVHRRRKVGFSLLDMLLTTVSGCFSSETAYDFVDINNDPVYNRSKIASRARQTYKVFISYRVRSKCSPLTEAETRDMAQGFYVHDPTWMKKLLEDKFNCVELVRFEAVHREVFGGKWTKGQPIWMDEVVFEHTCSYDPNSVGLDY